MELSEISVLVEYDNKIISAYYGDEDTKRFYVSVDDLNIKIPESKINRIRIDDSRIMLFQRGSSNEADVYNEDEKQPIHASTYDAYVIDGIETPLTDIIKSQNIFFIDQLQIFLSSYGIIYAPLLVKIDEHGVR